LMMLGIAAAAGAAAGMLADRKNPARGGVLGAAAAVVAGSVAAGVYRYMQVSGIPYYSSASSLYEETDLI
ncbi:MAG TPA: hypothetical protein VEP69_04315, partial [Thermodesulfovibrionales bacterium]|nr:hypothetical protein [Thermodesulfovibrionales bacterium]